MINIVAFKRGQKMALKAFCFMYLHVAMACGHTDSTKINRPGYNLRMY